MHIVVIDNYDSFTYNLVQYLGELGAVVKVYRNDRVTLPELERAAADRIVLSPGPGRPEEAGVTLEVLRTLGPRIPVLGVCLGHQAIGLAFGGQVVRAPRPKHGKTSPVQHDGTSVFAGLSTPVTVARYHSLMVADDGLPEQLRVTARAEDDGVVMGLRHRRFPIHGVQFHPESIMTASGRQILRTFLIQGEQ
jgi:anthranilate synthase/aminodeoxychorismate synthase-like glutamine amidotransferase